MIPDDISRLPPEYWQPIVSAAVRYFVNYGRPGSPGNREALFRIVKVALRYAHAGEEEPKQQPDAMRKAA